MIPKEAINKELSELSPFLAKLKEKDEGYSIPQDYFSTLPDEIMAQCTAVEAAKEQGKNSIWQQVVLFVESLFQPRIALAFASIALLVVAVVFFIPRENEGINMVQDLITEEEALTYIAENIEDFDLDFLEEDLKNDVGFEDAFDINEETLNEYIEDNILEDLDELTLEDLL